MIILFYKKKFDNEYNGIDSLYKLLKSNKNLPILSNRFFNTIFNIFTFKNNKKLIVHVNGIWTLDSTIILLIAFLFNVKTVVSPHGMLLKYALRNKSFKKKIAMFLYQKKILSKATIIHCTSKEELTVLDKLNLSNSYFIPLGVRVYKDNKILENIKNNKFNNNYILFIGRYNKIKNLDSLIKAWNKIRSSKWKLLIAGPDENEYKSYIKKLINQFSLNKSVYLFNHANDKFKNKLFLKSKFFIMPSYGESFGLVIGEALANYLPVIATIDTPWSEIEENKCGWLTKTDINSLTLTLRKVINLDEATRIKYSINANKLIYNNYNLDTMIDNFYDMYKSIL